MYSSKNKGAQRFFALFLAFVLAFSGLNLNVLSAQPANRNMVIGSFELDLPDSEEIGSSESSAQEEAESPAGETESSENTETGNTETGNTGETDSSANETEEVDETEEADETEETEETESSTEDSDELPNFILNFQPIQPLSGTQLAFWGFNGNAGANQASLANQGIDVAGDGTTISAIAARPTMASIVNQDISLLQLRVGNDARRFRVTASGASLVNAESGTGANTAVGETHWVVNLSTLGYEDIAVEWAMASSATGPRDWRLEYSTDNGATWSSNGIVDDSPTSNPGANVEISVAAATRQPFRKLLPSTASNTGNLQIRWVLTSTTALNGGATAAGGTSQISLISISGDSTSAPVATLNAPVVQAGANINLGDTITFVPVGAEASLAGYAIEVIANGTLNTLTAAPFEFTVEALPLALQIQAVSTNQLPSSTITRNFAVAPITTGTGLAEWSYATNALVNGAIVVNRVRTSGGIAPNHPEGSMLQLMRDGVAHNISGATNAISTSGFDNRVDNAHWLLDVSTLGYDNIQIEWRMRSSGTGPRDFRLQYSTDGTTWSDASNSPDIEIANGLAINVAGSLFTSALPISASNVPNLQVRLLLTSNTATNGNAIAAGGTNAINNIRVIGEPIPDPNQLRAPVATPASGEITIGTEIVFEPHAYDVGVAGFTAQTSVDGTNWVNTVNNTFTVTSLPLVLHVRATADAPRTPSIPITLTYEGAIDSIAAARQVLTMGGSGRTVTLRGTVTSVVAGNGSGNTIMMQDGTGPFDGIAIFGGATANAEPLNLIGREIEVTGTLSSFQGLPQIQASPNFSGVTNIGEGTNYPAVEVELRQILNGDYTAMRVSIVDFLIERTVGAVGTVGQEQVLRNHFITQNTQEVTFRVTDHNLNGFRAGDWVTAPQVLVNYTGANAALQLLMPPNAQLIGGEQAIAPDADGIAYWLVDGIPQGTSPTFLDATGGVHGANATLQMIVGGTPRVLGFVAAGGAGGASVSGLNGRADDAYWVVNISTRDFTNIEVSWAMRSTAAGARDFRLEYSLDGNTWLPANSANASIPGTQAGNRVSFNRTLPSAAADQDNIYIRWLLTSNTSVNGNTITTAATHQINNIIITGDYILLDGQLLPPVVTPNSGEVGIGTTINFAPRPTEADVAGYTVFVSANGGAFEAITGDSFVLEQLPMTLQVRSGAAGRIDSRITTHVFTQGQVPRPFTNRVPGTQVLLGSSLTLENAMSEATIFYSVNGGAEQIYTGSIVFTEDMFTGTPATTTITARATRDGFIDSEPITVTFGQEVMGGERIFFGQLHSHTTLSDGAGTVEEAFAWARDRAGLDFFAVTDHSNDVTAVPDMPDAGPFDPSPAGIDPATIPDLNSFNVTESARWNRAQQAARDAYRPGEFVSFVGFEMTWSGGPGHINTFATDGFVSRNNTMLNAKTNDAGLRAYYALLERTPSSISQFNHPGPTFGNFNDFAYLNPTIRQRMALIEVGNGEGAVGSSGYWPSYEEYILALDRGWHVAPTNNQDNHMGAFNPQDRNAPPTVGWGNSNTARTAIWTNDLSLEGVYNALRARRVYATEVADLEIVYHMNGLPLGTVLDEVPAIANFTAQITNPTAGNVVRSVSLVTNGGVHIRTQTPNTQNHFYEETIENPAPGYYFLWIVVGTPQGDRIAVTAPVWLGEGRLVGIQSVTMDTVLPATNEPFTLTTSVFSDEQENIIVESITYSVNGVQFAAHTLNATVRRGEVFVHHQERTPTQTIRETVDVTVIFRFADGHTMPFTQSIRYDVTDANNITYIGIDGSHFNEYVKGFYSEDMTNFIRLAAMEGVRVSIFDTAQELIAAATGDRYELIILNPPSRRFEPFGAGGGRARLTYSPQVLDALGRFAQSGRTLVVTGWSHLYENYADHRGANALPLTDLMSSQQNQVLAAAGSSLRIADNAASDTVANGGNDQWRVRLSDAHGSYNWNSPLLAGVDNRQIFSQFGGTTIYTVNDASDWNAVPSATVPSSVTPTLMLSAEGGSSQDRKTNNTPSLFRTDYTLHDGRHMIMAHETVTHANGNTSLVVAAGGAFMSNFEVQAELDNAGSLQFSNFNIAMNLIHMVAPEPNIMPIRDARVADYGNIITVEGIVTSEIIDTGRGFFDSIYIQDSTGGINLHPVSAGVELGQLIRVTGIASSFQDERQLGFVNRVQVIDPAQNPITPRQMSTADAMSPANTGLLVGTQGIVSDVRVIGGQINQFYVTDSTGVPARVFINAYITPEVDLSFVEEGALVSVIGLASVGENFTSLTAFLPRLRVRDRGEIVLLEPPTETPTTEAPTTEVPTTGVSTGNPPTGTTPPTTGTTSPEVPSTGTTSPQVPPTGTTSPSGGNGGGSGGNDGGSNDDREERIRPVVPPRATLVQPPSERIVLAAGVDETTLDIETLERLVERNMALTIQNDILWVTLSTDFLGELKGYGEDFFIQINLPEATDTDIFVLAEIGFKADTQDVVHFETPYTITVDMDSFDLDGINTNRIALVSDGEIILGFFDEETGLFVADVNHTGSFEVAYLPNLVVLELSTSSNIISEIIEGNLTTMDVNPVIQDGRTLIPVRFVAESLGAAVSWNAGTATATIAKGETQVALTIGQLAAGMDVPAQIINDRTMVPLRFVAENLGATVNWRPETGEIQIISRGLPR